MSRSYAGQSADDRAARRRARLVSAGVEIVGTQGASALGMRAVCREAGLSQKFFYESFADTDELLHAVYADTLARLQLALLTGARPTAARSAVDAAARLMRQDPRVCRILLMEPIADRSLRLHVRETLPPMVLGLLGRNADSPVDVATKLRFAVLGGGLISLFVEWTEGNLGDDRDVFVDHVTEFVLNALPRHTPQ